jgi:predicted Zn-dependent peptidase
MQQTKTFKSGMQVAVETLPYFESVSFNMFVNSGSTNEDDSNRGISHFIEHMLFKGTKNRSSIEIVTRLDAIGASVNAYTSKKETVYYTKSTKAGLNECIDILSDMYFNSTFDQKELTREKKVVVEEIAMYRDNPQAVADELAESTFYAGTRMSYDIAGTKTSVRNLDIDKIKAYMSVNYVPENLILSFSGNITMEEAENFAMKYYESNFKTTAEPKLNKTPEVLTIPKTKYIKKFKDNEQAQIIIRYPSINIHNKKQDALTLFNIVWGGGMSSRLFQIIREKLGLVYSIYSSIESSNYGGSISIALGTTSKNITVAVGALRKAIKTIVEDGITNQELNDAKTNITNTIKLKYENTSYISLYNAKHLSTYGYLRTKEDVIEKINALTKNDINNIADTVYAQENFVISMVGKDTKTDLLKHFIEVK